ncbi:MAG: HAMP domain-containing sensor histidine kinase [Candidatus Izemoplasma sp.]
MRVTIFFKTFLMLLITFSIVFLLSTYISYKQFSPMYIDENIKAVKEAIYDSSSEIRTGTLLIDTSLYELSRSETSFIRYKDGSIEQELGPDFITNEDIIFFVIDIYDSEDSISEGNLTYFVDEQSDIFNINYIYEFAYGDYLIVSTQIQSLENVDQVLININKTQSIYLFVVIGLISVILSLNISRPIKKINKYAKEVSNLNFDTKLNIKRSDEFSDLVSSLNEMTFNLKKSYALLNDANLKLNSDIDSKQQEETKKKNLIMTINHELKTPLAVMRGMIEGMIDGVGRFKDKEKYLSELLKEISSIENIASDLTYSLSLEDKAKVNDICNTSIINDNLVSLAELAKQNKVKITKKIICVDVNINDELLLILVSNLVKNAILYTTDKSVLINSEILNNEFILTIKNKGKIPNEDIEKIFESFYRANNTTITGGTGLGLFIVKQICDIYGYSYKIFNDNGYVIAKVNLKLIK